jgi:hypothetical protein
LVWISAAEIARLAEGSIERKRPRVRSIGLNLPVSIIIIVQPDRALINQLSIPLRLSPLLAIFHPHYPIS